MFAQHFGELDGEDCLATAGRADIDYHSIPVGPHSFHDAPRVLVEQIHTCFEILEDRAHGTTPSVDSLVSNASSVSIDLSFL